MYVRAREHLWRIKGGWPGFLALRVVAAVLVLLWQTDLFGWLRSTDSISPNSIPTVIVAAATVVASAVTLWGMVRGFGRWVFAASARGTRRFIDNTNDPMRLVHEHVGDLTRWVGYDVAVMIDDLDRYLAKHPEQVGAIGTGGPLPDVPEDVRPLFDNREVVDIVHGRAAGVHAKLDAGTLQTIVGGR